VRASQHPDGSFDVSGARYRLVDRAEDVFDVVSEADGAVAGCLRISHAGHTPGAEVMPGASAERVVRAIARLLSSPRGALPLQ
jgi:hypothetical protein